MLVLTACVQRLMYPLVLAPVNLLHHSGLEPRSATFVHFLLLLIVVVLCFFLAPAAVFTVMEVSWTFLDGIYFCFISLCTIGLGDFVPATHPGQKNRALYQVSVMGESTYYIPNTSVQSPHLFLVILVFKLTLKSTNSATRSLIICFILNTPCSFLKADVFLRLSSSLPLSAA